MIKFEFVAKAQFLRNLSFSIVIQIILNFKFDFEKQRQNIISILNSKGNPYIENILVKLYIKYHSTWINQAHVLE